MKLLEQQWELAVEKARERLHRLLQEGLDSGVGDSADVVVARLRQKYAAAQ